MAAKKKIHVQQHPERPLETYGCKADPALIRAQLGPNAQFFYNQWAFANRVNIDEGAPPRPKLFKRITDFLVPEYFEWHPWTNRMVDALCHNQWIAITGCSGSAKAQPLDSIVWTPLGPKKMGDIKVGDEVCNASGGKSVVEGVFPQGEQEIYEIEFSDGRTVKCTADHLWKVGLSRHDWDGKLKVLPLSEMMCRKTALDRRKTRFTVPKPMAVEMAEKEVPMDPYLLGVLIGDGAFSNSNICFATTDQEVLDIVKSKIALPYQVRWLGRCDYCITFPGHRWSELKGKKRTGNPYKDALKTLGLWGLKSDFKFIPDIYLNNSIAVRLAMLQGLMDTDGTAHQERNSAVFCTTSRKLADGVRLLVESFGGACRIWEWQPTFTYNGEKRLGKTAYKCTIEHENHQEFFKLTRKRSQLKPRTTANEFRYIKDIRKLGIGLAQCIKVSSPDSLYLTDGFVVTHNTHNVAGFACAWWLCAPKHSSVIFCSTTAKALRKRGWSNVQNFHSMISPRVGNFVDSRMMWQWDKGDDKHAIMGVAVEEGQLAKVADNIKGVHTIRQMVVIDEATAVPQAIYDACTNLYSYPKEFVLVLLGNMRSWLDQFGHFAEPDAGITSVSVDSEEWETRPQINGKKGICIRFDVEKSPNLDVPEDKPVSKHLPSQARVRALKNNPGYANTPQYWSNERGFPPPEGLSKHVFSEVSFANRNVYDRHKFTGVKFQIIGAFDHARAGGDVPTLRFAALGEIESGDMGIEWMKPIPIPVNVALRNPIDYQILEQVRRECEHVDYRGMKMVCPPENLGVDATGGGADLCDIFNRMWSFLIIRIGFGEAASTDACSHEDIRPANEVYRNRRAEMYFRTRDAAESGQLKGIDKETAREMTTIDFVDERGDGTQTLRKIIPKKDYKATFGNSPDKTDSGVMITEVARRKGFRLAVQGQTKIKAQEVTEDFKRAQEVYADVSYGPEELDEVEELV